METYRNQASFSRWDGTHNISALSADDIMKAIADELVDDGDLMRALRQLFREGVETADGERLPGWYDMLQKVRQAKQEQLNRFDMGSVIEDIRHRIQDVVTTERDGIETRLEEAEGRLADAEASATQSGDTDPNSPSLEDEHNLTEMLRQMARKKQDQLNDLPPDPAGAIKALQEYDFLSPAARQKFADLLQMLQ